MRDQAQLRILFEKPGFFLTDIRLVISFDGTSIHDGSFLSGVDRVVPALPGAHRIETRLYLTDSLCRTKGFDFTLDDGPRHTAVLKYSRFWGNFSRKLDLRAG